MKRFTATSRAVDLESLRHKDFDLIVIGGGVTGAGIALDSASRGLKTVLLEKSDFASGTSSKSTKLIHGGLRYLKQFEIALVRETGTERAVVHGLAPHLVHPERMLLPIVENGSFGKLSASIAISVYDYLAGVQAEDRKVGLSSEEILQEEPLIKAPGLNGGMKYAEYRTDDARLTIELVKAAVQHGAYAFNYCELTDFLYEEGKIKGARARDHVTGMTIDFHARHVVSAAGPWVDHVRRKDGSTGGKSLHLTKGVHVVFPKEKLPLKNSVYFDAFDGRMIFAIPRGKVTYVGTSDTTYHDDLDRVLCTAEDARYLLNAVNNYFHVDGLTPKDIVSSWAGLRPLIHEDGKSPSELSRKDEIFEAPSGLISIAGGKLTGYRKMAERILNLVLHRRGEHRSRPCRTSEIPLHADPYRDYASVKDHMRQLEGQMSSVPDREYHAWRLISTYGKTAEDIWKSAQDKYEAEWAEAFLHAELEHCIDFESVVMPQDFLNRRTGRLYFDIESVQQFQEDVLHILEERFSWSRDRIGAIRNQTCRETEDCLLFRSH